MTIGLVASVVAVALTVVLGRLAGRTGAQHVGDAVRNQEQTRPFDPSPASARGGPNVWLVTGQRGRSGGWSAGLLAKVIQTRGAQVVLAEVYARPENVDELEAVLESLGVRVVHHAFGSDPGAVVADAISTAKRHAADLVIVDATLPPVRSARIPETMPLWEIHAVASRDAEVTEVLVLNEAPTGPMGAPALIEGLAATGVLRTHLRRKGPGDLDHLTLRRQQPPHRQP